MQSFEQQATTWNTSNTASGSQGSAEESLVLAACPSAVSCSTCLVRAELPRWGLEHLVSTVEALTGEVVDQIVQTIGPVEPPSAWAENQDVPMLRCVLWADGDLAGVRIWDPTGYVIPSPPSRSLFPSVQWGSSRTEPYGKWTWFQLPITVGRPDPNAPHTVPIPRVNTGSIPTVSGSGSLPRVPPEGRYDRYAGLA